MKKKMEEKKRKKKNSQGMSTAATNAAAAAATDVNPNTLKFPTDLGTKLDATTQPTPKSIFKFGVAPAAPFSFSAAAPVAPFSFSVGSASASHNNAKQHRRVPKNQQSPSAVVVSPKKEEEDPAEELVVDDAAAHDRYASKMTSAKMTAMLDTVDKVRTTLGGLKSNQLFYEELLASLPQFVACGPQSAGKSSVIRRVSGVSLPEASTACTRIATIIQMRRAEVASTRVTLTGPNSNLLLNESIEDTTGSVRNVVKKAQKKALELSPFKRFVEDHNITVHVTGPDLINVTLVDLPGFHTADDNDTKTVNNMVKRYVEMPGTLVLHVVKGDQDYASLLGNDFMRKTPNYHHDDGSIGGGGRVTVLTHCDKIDANSPDDVTRLRTTLDTTAANSTLTVAIMGSVKEANDEETQLEHLTNIDHRLEVGVKELSIHLEERMREHMYQQFPKAVTKLETSLSATITQLDSVRERSPIEVLCEMVQTIRNNFHDEKKQLMNALRVILDEMTRDIKNFTLWPIKIEVANCHVTPRDQFEEDFEPGQLVYASVAADANSYKLYYFVKYHDTDDTKIVLRPKNGGENITRSIDTLQSGETADIDSIVKDIEQLGSRDRGMRNLVHCDRQPIIEAYAKQFADYYTEILNDSLSQIEDELDEFYNTVFSHNINDLARPVSDHLRKKMELEIEEARKMAESAIAGIQQHNTNSDLIFSPNEHYLNSLVQQMVEADTGMASDSGGARHIYHNVRAFIKVQRKYISELASKEMIRTTIVETECRFRQLFDSNIGQTKLIAMIHEPSKVRRERQTLTKRKTVLEEALELAKECC